MATQFRIGNVFFTQVEATRDNDSGQVLCPVFPTEVPHPFDFENVYPS